MSKRFSVEGSMIRISPVEKNPDYEKELQEHPIGPDDDPTDGPDEFLLTIQVTVRNEMDVAALKAMEYNKQRINIDTA